MGTNGGGDYTTILDTIVPVNAGQRISLFWFNDQGGEIVGDSEQIFTHLTGEYLGSGEGFSILFFSIFRVLQRHSTG